MTDRICRKFEFEIIRRDFETYCEHIVKLVSVDYAYLAVELTLLGHPKFDRLVLVDESSNCRVIIRVHEGTANRLLKIDGDSFLEIELSEAMRRHFWRLCIESYEKGGAPVGHIHFELEDSANEVTFWFPDVE